jgi:hypothetical protein
MVSVDRPGQLLDPEHASVSGSSFPSKGQSQYPSLIQSAGMTRTSLFQPLAQDKSAGDANAVYEVTRLKMRNHCFISTFSLAFSSANTILQVYKGISKV